VPSSNLLAKGVPEKKAAHGLLEEMGNPFSDEETNQDYLCHEALLVFHSNIIIQ